LSVPDLRQLRVFVAVAQERNFTRAAERLHLAQQAVSKSVAQLERELGVELLERTSREVRLTAAGAALLEAGPEALASADRAFARAREVGRGLEGTVRVGASPAVGSAVLDEVARVLRDGAPDLSVSVLEVRPAEIPRLLRDRELDLVLTRTDRGAPEVQSASLRPTPATLAVPAGHPLANGGEVTLARLDGARLLAWSPPGTPFTDLLVSRLAAAGARVEPVESRVTGAPALAQLAEQDAVALMPRGFAAPPGVVELPIRDEITLPLLVLWAAGAPSAAVQRIRAGMSDYA
jgi:DNA-binding transcriptional LysR family regulator